MSEKYGPVSIHVCYDPGMDVPEFTPNGLINVCLCDNTPNGHTLQYGWEQCSLHDAVKLASMKGIGVLLHVKNERGDIVPLRGEA